MPSLDKLKESDLKKAAELKNSMVRHFDKNSFDKYASYVKLDKYEEACNGNGGKCFLVDKQTRCLGLISKGACLVNYHEEHAVSKYDLNHQMFITPLLYGKDQHLNASLVPDVPNGTQRVWISLQWRKAEHPNRPGEWDGKERECDRYVLGEFVIVEKIKRGNFECILLLLANHSLTNTFALLERYAAQATYIKKLEQEAGKHKLQMTAITKSRDFNRESAQKLLQDKDNEHKELKKNMEMLNVEVEKKASLLKKKEAFINKLRNEKGQDSAEITENMQNLHKISDNLEGLRAELHKATNNEKRLIAEVLNLQKELEYKTKEHDFEKKRNDNQRDDYRGNPSLRKAPMAAVKRGGAPSSGKAKFSRR